MSALLVNFFQRCLKVYHWLISPLLGNRCRFAPSCSDYAHQALAQHGVIKGLGLTVKRLGRCHPWGGSGFDPVPNIAQVQDSKSRVRDCVDQVQDCVDQVQDCVDQVQDCDSQVQDCDNKTNN